MVKSNILSKYSNIGTDSLVPYFKWIGIIILINGFHSAIAQNPEKLIREGNKLYKESLFTEAEAKFAEALEVDPNYDKGIFNQGNALYKQEKFEEALKNYELSAGLMEDAGQKASAYHNLGNTYFANKQYDESVEAYKNALRSNPNDSDTKYNLMLAKKLLEQQQQQEQDQDQDDKDQKEDKDSENKEDKENNEGDQDDQQDGNDKKESEDKKEDQGKENSEGKGDDKEEKQQPAMSPSKLSPEEVQRILEALSNDEKQTVKEIMKKEAKTKPNKSDKDW